MVCHHPWQLTPSKYDMRNIRIKTCSMLITEDCLCLSGQAKWYQRICSASSLRMPFAQQAAANSVDSAMGRAIGVFENYRKWQPVR